MPPELIVLAGRDAAGKPPRRFVTTDAPNINRIAPAFPTEVIDFLDEVRSAGGSILSARWSDDHVEIRFLPRAGGTMPRVMEFRRAKHLVEDEEVSVELDKSALMATAEREARHAELEAAGVIVLDRYSVGNR